MPVGSRQCGWCNRCLDRGRNSHSRRGAPGEACPQSCPLQPLLPGDRITPPSTATPFYCQNKGILRMKGDTVNSYRGTVGIKWLSQANHDVSLQQ